MPGIKIEVTEETLEFINEEFPDGITQPDQFRIAIGVLRFVRNNNIEGLQEFLREEGIGELDAEEIAIEGMKRAILESDEVDLSDFVATSQPDEDSDDE